MKYGISGEPVFAGCPGAAIFNQAGGELDFWPAVLAAIGACETLIEYSPDEAATIVSPDQGKGWMQLTDPESSIPTHWEDPLTNVRAAITGWLNQLVADWVAMGFTGWTLVRLVADSWNEGLSAAEYWHKYGNADLGTTGGNYGTCVALNAQQILAGQMPTHIAGQP